MTANLTQIATVAAGECIRQHVGIERLSTLLEGYGKVLNGNLTYLDITSEFVAALGGIVEPDNKGRFRASPVTFASGGTAAHHAEVERLIFTLTTHGDALSPAEWVKQFLWIHPFTDGNGRTAWVLWNFLNGTMDNPTALPDFFNEG